jgi:hypothetical protein
MPESLPSYKVVWVTHALKEVKRQNPVLMMTETVYEVLYGGISRFTSIINETGDDILEISLYPRLLPYKIKRSKNWNDEFEILLSPDEEGIVKPLN